MTIKFMYLFYILKIEFKKLCKLLYKSKSEGRNKVSY